MSETAKSAPHERFEHALRQARGDLCVPAEPETWTDFLDAIREARAELGNPDVIWYRGHSKEEYLLTPSLLRYTDGVALEKNIFNEYERSAERLHKKRDSDWGVVFDMQHYGIPTRLLDWTDTLGIAIAFALLDSASDCQSAVINVLNPIRLNQKQGLTEIKRVPDGSTFGYKSVYWQNNPISAIYPIAVEGIFQSDRMFAQRGSFTVHGSDCRPLEIQAADCVRKILIKPAVRRLAREFLEHANLNIFSIYPDIQGMSRHISQKYFGLKMRAKSS